MGVVAKQMTIDEFFAWQLQQEERFELVDGYPVEMMSGASGRHDDVVVNIIAALKQQLRGKRCRPRTADTAIRTSIKGLRRADVLVTCEPPRDDAYEAAEPRLVVEVLSPSNTGIAWERKLKEYRRHKQLEYILLVDSRVMAATLYTRTETGWTDTDADRPEDMLSFPTIGCSLSMADIYDGTELEPERP